MINREQFLNKRYKAEKRFQIYGKSAIILALLFLALFTTVIGHSLFLHSLKYFTVTTASLMSSINPLYGILIAYIFLNEIPHWGVYIGGALIIFAVLFENRFSR